MSPVDVSGESSSLRRRSEVEWSVSEVLFDLDGTLVDSVAAIEDAWRMWAEAESTRLPVGGSFHGRTAFDLVSSLLPADRVADGLTRLTEIETNPRLPVPAAPGARQLLDALPAGRWAVVTSAARPVASARLRAGGIPMPELLVSGDDVVHGKPAPDPYLAGRRSVSAGVAPVAFEDTVAGLRSARAAGCLTVGVVGTVTGDELAGAADAVIESLCDVSIAGWDERALRLRLRPLR